MKLSRTAVIFLGTVLILSGVYFVYASLTMPPTAENEGVLGEIGEGIGVLVSYALVILYCRGLVKLVLNKGAFLGRFLPAENDWMPKNSGEKLLAFLNRTHPALGVLTILFVVLHAEFSSTGKMNLFLLLTMVVMFWQGAFGLFLRSRLTPGALRRQSYGVHAQLVTGGLILIFASFGHLLVGD